MSNRRKPRSPRRDVNAISGTNGINVNGARRARGSHERRDRLGAAGRPVAKIRSPADAVAMIPYVLGYEPHESVVVVSLSGANREFGPTVRADIGDAEHAPAFVDHVVATLRAQGCSAALVVAFSTQPSRADAIVPRLADALAEVGITVFDALRADGARWWSYGCEGDCCPSEGTPYDSMSSAVAALAVANGMAKASSREALADQFAPRDSEVRAAVAAVARAVAGSVAGDPPSVEEVDELVLLASTRPTIGPRMLGILLGVVQDRHSRDIAWLLMSRPEAALHFEVWRQVMNAADDDLMVPAGSLCAFAAWLTGAGALALTAVERVEEVNADYPMLGLVRCAIESGIDPRVWDEQRRGTGPPAPSPEADGGAVADDAAG